MGFCPNTPVLTVPGARCPAPFIGRGLAPRLEPAADLSGAMAASIARLASEGWQAEATPAMLPH